MWNTQRGEKERKKLTRTKKGKTKQWPKWWHDCVVYSQDLLHFLFHLG
jgi:hypothetical protein